VAVPKGNGEAAQTYRDQGGGGKDQPAEWFGGAFPSLGMGRHGNLHVCRDGYAWRPTSIGATPKARPFFANDRTFAETY
jgi:hypothetical protein